MNPYRIGAGLWLLFTLLLSTPALAQNTYENLNGWFKLDIPAGWELQPQQNDYLFQFKGDGTEQILIFFEPDATDKAALFTQAVENFKSSVANGAPEGDIVDLTVNSHAARWSIYRGTLKTQGVEVALVGFLGSMVLENGGLYYFTIVAEISRAEWEEKYTKTFHSLREVDAEVIGVGESAAVSPAVATPPQLAASEEPTPYEQKYVSLTLPPGWSAEPLSEPLPDGTVAKLSSSEHSANVVIGCFNVLKTWITPKKNDKKLYQEGQQVIRSALPTSVSLEGPYEFKNPDKKKIIFEVYSGHMIVEGKEIPMHALQATGKTKRCKEGLSFYGFVGSDDAAVALPEMKKNCRIDPLEARHENPNDSPRPRRHGYCFALGCSSRRLQGSAIPARNSRRNHP